MKAELEPIEIHKLIQSCACEKGPIAARDTALLVLLYAAGINGTTIVDLDLLHLDVENRVLTVYRGQDVGQYYLGEVWELLKPWLRERGGQAGPLLLGVDKAGRLIERRLSPQVVHDVVTKRAKKLQRVGVSASVVRRLANRERLRLKLSGWSDRDEHGRVCCLPFGTGP